MSTKLPTRGRTPLGFKRRMYTTASGRVMPDGLEPNPDEAAFVVGIFELSAEGLSCAEIARHLEARTGECWTRHAVRDLLVRKLYLHEDVVDRSLWQRSTASLRSHRPKWKGTLDG